MLSINPELKLSLQSPIKDVKGYLELADGTLVTKDDNLVSYEIHATGELLKPSMKQIDITLHGDYVNLKGESLTAHYGVYKDGDYEYAQLGIFTILEAEKSEDTDDTTLKGYDNMVHFMKDYLPVSDFPTTLGAFTQALSAGVGVTLESNEIYNSNLPMPEDYWATIPEATYRDVLTQICEVTVSNARIKPSGELELIPIDHQTGETLTYDNLLEYKLEDSWGDVNSLVLSRQPQNDDIFQRDEEAINAPTNRNILDLNKFNVGYIEGGA